MNAWYKSVPAHWGRARVKSVARRITDGAHISPDTEQGIYDFVSTRDVKAGKINYAGSLKTSSATYEYMVKTGCRPNLGDVLFSKDGTVGETAIVMEQREFAVASSLVIITPRASVMTPSYLAYVFASKPAQEQAASFMRGAGLPRLSVGNLARLTILVPPLEEQRAIAMHLDRQVARIDTLIEEQQRLIDMLRERRLGVVRAGVTGLQSGGNRGTSDTWFGILPDTWTSARLRYDFTVILGKMINASKVPLEDTLDAPYLAAGSIQPDSLVLDESKRMVFTKAELTTLDLRKGDVVVVEGGAGYGRSHYLRYDLQGWGFQNHVARLRPATGRVDGLFATYCLKACLASGYIEANNRTATLPSLSRDVLGSIQIPVPPLTEQRKIVQYLDEQTMKIDELITETERFIELSRERRSALITAAVTGQIDVPAVA